jgi:glycosyltransferase involved in cell wall biosynthesis
MKREVDISVVVGTYNRSRLLADALDSLLDQRGAPPYEIIIVDNNSKDSTRELVQSRIAEGPSNLRYLFEPKQGTSYARNAGVRCARGSIIAFTDDDVRVSRDWIANVKREFLAHPEAEFLGGKILPRWKTPPPEWLTRDHWWPLALLDCGDQPFYVDADHPVCLPTANASFRARVFKRFGLFAPEFSGREDHEFLVRLWRAGCRGLYVPTVVAHAEVQDERLKKAYHRAWNIKTGQFNSLMRLNEITGSDGRIAGDCPDMVTLFGVPAFVYRDFLAGGAGWVAGSLLGRQASALRSKNCFWYFAGYISMRYQQNAFERDHSGLLETARFLKNFCNKKLRWKRSAAGQSVSEISGRETI